MNMMETSISSAERKKTQEKLGGGRRKPPQTHTRTTGKRENHLINFKVETNFITIAASLMLYAPA